MAETAYTHSGDKFYISTTTQNEDLDDHATTGFPSLIYTEVKGIGNFGEAGITTNIVDYPTWGTTVTSKGKGISNAGDPDVEMLRIIADPGQVAMRAAGDPENADNYAFKHVKQNGETVYYRGLVTGPRHPNGGNEDFDLDVYTLALQQKPVHVAPAP